MKRSGNFSRFLFSLMTCSCLAVLSISVAEARGAEPVITTGGHFFSGGDGQSRVWFAQGQWWAWLPDGNSGSGVWRRSVNGRWTAEQGLDGVLKALPPNADVWFENYLVVAVLHDDKKLAVAALAPDTSSGGYVSIIKPLIWEDDGVVARAYINKDGSNNFYVIWSSDHNGVRSIKARQISGSISQLGNSFTLASGLGSSDGCNITRLNAGLLVIWSDSGQKKIFAHRHSSKAADTLWIGPDTLAENVKVCDPTLTLLPLNAKFDGLRLIAASKIASSGSGQSAVSLVAMRRHLEWSYNSLSLPGTDKMFTAPIVLWRGSNPVAVYIGEGTDGDHTVRWATLDYQGMTATGETGILLEKRRNLASLTTAKYLPQDREALFLVSDSQGNVYETILR